MISEWHIIIGFALAGVGCMVYTATRYRRKARAIWGLMVIPCLEFIILYLYFIYGNLPTAERVQPFRIILLSVALQISAISITLAYRDYKNVNTR